MTDKLVDLSLANDFVVDLKFETALPDPTVDTKLLFPPKNTEKLCGAELTMLNTINAVDAYHGPLLEIGLEELLLGKEVNKCTEELTEEERILLEEE